MDASAMEDQVRQRKLFHHMAIDKRRQPRRILDKMHWD
jgi:hypothetical protein